MTENEIGRIVVETAIMIHNELGPGLLESVYETVLVHELQRQGLFVTRQVPIPIVFRDIQIEEGFRADIIVENKVLLELKSVQKISSIHFKQLMTYLRLTKIKLGFLLNFNTNLMREGIFRRVNGLEE